MTDTASPQLETEHAGSTVREEKPAGYPGGAAHMQDGSSEKRTSNPYRIYRPGDDGYKRLQALCDELNAMETHSSFHVEDTYFDYGRDRMWTTIIARRDDGRDRGIQVLSPAEFDSVMDGADPKAMADAIVNDPRYGRLYTEPESTDQAPCGDPPF